MKQSHSYPKERRSRKTSAQFSFSLPSCRSKSGEEIKCIIPQNHIAFSEKLMKINASQHLFGAPRLTSRRSLTNRSTRPRHVVRSSPSTSRPLTALVRSRLTALGVHVFRVLVTPRIFAEANQTSRFAFSKKKKKTVRQIPNVSSVLV